MRDFCSYFDSNYAMKGLALFNSLKRLSSAPFRLHVACLDERAFQLLSALDDPSLNPIPLSAIKEADPEFAACENDRSRVEFYFTLSPVLPLYLLERGIASESVCCLDSDLLFYSDPGVLFDELGDASIFITEHRFPPHLKAKEAYGRYNVQCQIFRNDQAGLECLRWWRARCVEWCFDRLEGERFADQKYLEKWPAMFGRRLVVSSAKGVGLAPWNCSNYELRFSDDARSVDGEPLVFYHFQGFKIVAPFLLNHGLGYYGNSMPSRELRWLYVGYYRELLKAKATLAALDSPAGCAKQEPRSGRWKSGARWTKLGNLFSKEWRESVLFTTEGLL